ncbi:MAG TPA: FAD/FMN-containing dehydrogenase [Gammaproteobacteria bacterium]|nr:FAD/FMN-containing dehydrogenase [Gammaproteobacteria bacterium]
MNKLAGLCFLLLSCLPALAATPVQVGDRLDAFTLADQHGKPRQVDEATKLLLFSRDMKANKLARAAFRPKPAQYLPEAQAAYVIDVSGMPRFVTDNFAIPKMQKYGYPILLDREAGTTAALPSQKGQVTLIRLERLSITGIDYATTASALNRAVDAAAQPAPARTP